MLACVDVIERLDHHPSWRNSYNRVDIHLDTFDAGNQVTALDIELATALEHVVETRGRDFGLVDRGATSRGRDAVATLDR